MKRVLIIGNSHAGAIKLGWDSAPREDLAVTFLVAPQRTFVHMRLDPQQNWGLRADLPAQELATHRQILTDLNGLEGVRLTDYDDVVLVGWPSGADELTSLALTCTMDGHASPLPRSTLLSRPVLHAFLAGLARDLRPPEGFWRTEGPRMYLLPRPTLAQTVLGSRYWTYRGLHKLIRQGLSLQPLIDQFDDLRRTDLASIGITYLAQPSATRTPSGLTAAQYLRSDAGHVDPKTPRARGDHIHMNAEFGAQSLRALWRAMGLTTADPAE